MFLIWFALAPVLAFTVRPRIRWRRTVSMLWARGIALLIGMRVTVQGTPPEPPFFIVANHVSHVDGYLLCSILGCQFIAKSEVASWPVFGFMVRQANVIFVNRKKPSDTLRVNELIGSALANGDGIAMFAESTTSRGQTIRPFKTALLEPAVRNNIPVHYATIHYATPEGAPPASAWVCWWQKEPFVKHVLRLLGYPGFTATVTFGESPIATSDRKELAQKLWDAAMAQFTPID